MVKFIGRARELKKINDLSSRDRPILVVIKGRRRIGKSRLAKECGKGKIFLPFTALAPTEGVSAQNQKDHFATQLAKHFQTPRLTFTDWSNAFEHLTYHLSQEPTVLLFDEISWIGSQDPLFIPKLKAWWDVTLPDYPHLTLILCSSVSTWIEDNIINSTAFFGRISQKISLDELTLSEAHTFLKEIGLTVSTYDIFKILSITGGVPWYLEQINPQETIDENIKRLCFEKDGAFVDEFDIIFNDLFENRSELYKKVIYSLADGMKTLSQLRKELGYARSGSFGKYLQDLCTSGFITQNYTWSIKTGKVGKQNLYRLSDNYLRFYIKYIEPNLAKIRKNTFQKIALSALPGWETMMGFQVENLLLRNRYLLLEALGVNVNDIVADNPYRQRTTTRQQGCQIDYLIQTHSNNLFVCEFKFRKRELGIEVIKSMQEKIYRFSVPKGYGVSPVLVHLGGVSDAVHDRRYFYKVIDLYDFIDSDESS